MKEKMRLGRNLRNAVLALDIAAGAVLGAIAAPQILHPEEANNALAALAGTLDCGKSITPYETDAILVPGAGMTRNNEGVYAPDYHQEIRLQGAAILYSRSNPSDRPYVVLLNGAPDKQDPLLGKSVVDYLQEEVKTRSEDHLPIPSDHILIDQNSINTVTNMAEAERFANLYGFESEIIVTSDSHRSRSELFACNNGLRATAYSAEVLITEADQHAEKTFDDDGRRLLEQSEILFAYWDPQGIVPTVIKSHIHNSYSEDVPQQAFSEN